MKKIIAVIILATFLLPEQALCLRPVASKNSLKKTRVISSITKHRRGRPSQHPGKEKLREYIITYKAYMKKIAKKCHVSLVAVSRWINSDEELNALAEFHRRLRNESSILTAFSLAA